MKWTVLVMAIMMLICTSVSAQPTTYPPTPTNPSQIFPTQGTSPVAPAQVNVTYSTTTSGGAPIPIAPTGPESQGIGIPSDITTVEQGPTAQESTQMLMRSTQDAAIALAPTDATASATYQVYQKMVIPPTVLAPNKLYISYSPRTIASCNLYANLPLWMSVSGTGAIWFYEWYPSGWLDTQYAGSVYYPGWYKRWFFADTPGWHILQYYCGGWSNYAYIYVQGYGGYWVNPNPSPGPSPYPYPYWDSQITYIHPGTGNTYYSYQWTSTEQDGI
jgi:hypothetical protein